MTPRSPKSPARKKALPPIYVVLDKCDGIKYAGASINDASDVFLFGRASGARLVKYLPAPVPPRSRKSKGGGR